MTVLPLTAVTTGFAIVRPATPMPEQAEWHCTHMPARTLAALANVNLLPLEASADVVRVTVTVACAFRFPRSSSLHRASGMPVMKPELLALL